MRIFRVLWHRILPSDTTTKTTFVGAIFGKYLLATNIISSGVLMSIGDLMSQEIEYRNGTSTITKRYDWKRNAKMFIVGAAQGPLHHYFYGWLDRAYLGATIKTTTIKILYDQLIMSPVCIAAFFYTAGWLDGKDTSGCTDEFQSKFKIVYITDWLVWPGAQFINFYYLAPKYRVIYVNFVTMLYNVFLSYIKHEDDEDEGTSGKDSTKQTIIPSVKCLGQTDEDRVAAVVVASKNQEDGNRHEKKISDVDTALAPRQIEFRDKFV